MVFPDESEQAVVEARRATAEAQRQADEAHRQAEAAVDQVNVMREDGRAWIGVAGATFTNKNSTKEPLKVRV